MMWLELFMTFDKPLYSLSSKELVGDYIAEEFFSWFFD